jgi:hypothetical protein
MWIEGSVDGGDRCMGRCRSASWDCCSCRPHRISCMAGTARRAASTDCSADISSRTAHSRQFLFAVHARRSGSALQPFRPAGSTGGDGSGCTGQPLHGEHVKRLLEALCVRMLVYANIDPPIGRLLPSRLSQRSCEPPCSGETTQDNFWGNPSRPNSRDRALARLPTRCSSDPSPSLHGEGFGGADLVSTWRRKASGRPER